MPIKPIVYGSCSTSAHATTARQGMLSFKSAVQDNLKSSLQLASEKQIANARNKPALIAILPVI